MIVTTKRNESECKGISRRTKRQQGSTVVMLTDGIFPETIDVAQACVEEWLVSRISVIHLALVLRRWMNFQQMMMKIVQDETHCPLIAIQKTMYLVAPHSQFVIACTLAPLLQMSFPFPSLPKIGTTARFDGDYQESKAHVTTT